MKFLKVITPLFFSFLLISCSSSPVSPGGSGFNKPLPETSNISESCKPVKFVPPAYPGNALARNLEGWAHIGFDLDASGKAANIKMLDESSSGFGREGAKALQQFEFEPSAVENNCSYIFKFHLSN